MSTVRSGLERLAAKFVEDAMNLIEGASLKDLLGEGGSPRRASRSPRNGKGRLPRRSPEELAKVTARIVALVKGKKDGLKAEDIGKALKLASKELPKPIEEGL